DGALDIVTLNTGSESVSLLHNRTYDLGRPIGGGNPAVDAGLQLLTIRALPSGAEVPLNQHLVTVPEGSTALDVLYLLGPAVLAGPDGVIGNADDVDLRGTFQAASDKTTLQGRIVSPRTIRVRVPLAPNPTTLTASIETSVPGTSRRARDEDLLILMTPPHAT